MPDPPKPVIDKFKEAARALECDDNEQRLDERLKKLVRHKAGREAGRHGLISAARLKRARRRMRGYFLGSGVILAFLYLLAGAFLVHIFGVEPTRYWSAVGMAAGVMLGGTYGLVMIVALAIHIVRRLIKRRPIMDIKD